MVEWNKVILIGNIGADPELRYTPNGSAVSNFNIATNESWNDKSGERQERTEWHRIVVWGRLAEICNQYLRKGSKVFIEGRLQTRSWEGQDGQKRYTTEVVARDMQMLSGRDDPDAGGGFSRDSVRRQREPPAIGRVPPKRAAVRTRVRAGRARRTTAPTTISRSEHGGARHREGVRKLSRLQGCEFFLQPHVLYVH